MYFPVIPYPFIYSCAYLSWRDVLWAYERKLVGWEFIVGIADFHVSNGSYDALEMDLICLGGFDIQEIENRLHALAGKVLESERVGSKEKWLFVALKWLFENKEIFSDPLGEVELLYEEFDFPPEIESFVRYMPSSDGYNPQRYGFKENLERLFHNWSGYLERMEMLLAAEI